MDSLDWLRNIATIADPCAMLERVTGSRADPWQSDFFGSDDPFLLVLASRGVGKSTSVAVLAYTQAEMRPRQTILLLAPALRQSEELFRKVLDVRRAFGAVHIATRETMLLLELTNGSRIITAPATEKTIRGYRSHLVVCDEAARIADDEFQAIVPMLTEDGRLIACTTPAGRRGWFYEAHKERRGRLIRARSTELPRMAKIVARDRRMMAPNQFRTEHELEFQGSGDAFFNLDDVEGMFSSNIAPLRLAA